MLTQEQLLDYIDKNYNFHLMDYQKTVLWEFYKKWKTDGDFVFTYRRRNGKMFMYQIMKELLEYEHQMKE
jgi:hypothetical protein